MGEESAYIRHPLYHLLFYSLLHFLNAGYGHNPFLFSHATNKVLMALGFHLVHSTVASQKPNTNSHSGSITFLNISGT